MQVLVQKQVIDEGIHDAFVAEGRFNDFHEAPVKDDIVCSHKVVGADLQGQVIQEEHHAAPSFAKRRVCGVFNYLPNLSVVACRVKALAELRGFIRFVCAHASSSSLETEDWSGIKTLTNIVECLHLTRILGLALVDPSPLI